MATDFKYASQSDMNRYVGDVVTDADSKRQVYGWSVLSSNKYIADNTGLITQLFIDGADLGAAQGSAGDVNSNFKWYYLSSDDRVYLYNDASDPNDLIMEAGFDNATYYDQMLDLAYDMEQERVKAIYVVVISEPEIITAKPPEK